MRAKFAGLQLKYTEDALNSTAALFRASGYQSIWATGALARTALESAATLCHLIAPQDAPELRLLRAATLGIEGRRQEIELYRTISDPTRPIRQRESIRTLALAAGLEPLLDTKANETGLRRGDDAVRYRWKLTDIVSQWMTGLLDAYRSASPAAHGAWWYVGGAFDAPAHPQLSGVNDGGQMMAAIHDMEACRAIAPLVMTSNNRHYAKLVRKIEFRRHTLKHAWLRVRTRFSNDDRVREQIAATQATWDRLFGPQL